MNDTIKWHDIIQEILKEYLGLMSGKEVQEAGKERATYFQADYYCLVTGNLDLPDKPKVMPFDHLKERNIIEYKSIHQTLNEARFRHYIGRALLLENPEGEASFQGKMTLTILTTRKPEKLFAVKQYKIKAVNRWKYVSSFLKDLDIYILVQKEMRGEKAGEALALLQVLEGERERQVEFWNELLNQNLANVDVIKKIIQEISQEAYMNLVTFLKNQGRAEGIAEGEMKGRIAELVRIIKRGSPKLLEKYGVELKNVKTLEEFDVLEEKIWQELEASRF